MTEDGRYTRSWTPWQARALVLLLLTFITSCAGSVADGPQPEGDSDASHPSQKQRSAWSEEIVGVSAAVNDVVALELLPALFGVDALGSVVVIEEQPTAPDFEMIAGSCADLEPLAGELAGKVTGAPVEFRDAAALVEEWARSLDQFADKCQAAASTNDPDTLAALAPLLMEMSGTVRRLSEAIPPGTQCPQRLRESVVSCASGEAGQPMWVL